MKRAGILLLMAAAVLAAAVPRVKRAALAALEKSFDNRLLKSSPNDPFELLTSTVGVYLDGYGVVFTNGVNLIVTPSLNPFRLSMTKQEIASIHERKLRQLPLLRENMREMLFKSAAALEELPPNEQVVLAVSLAYFYWEDTKGLPSQILMQGERQKLLSHDTRDSAIRVQEY